MTTHAFDEYLENVSPDHRKLLDRVAEQIRKVAPDTEELISYGIPTFKYRGRPLLYFAAHKQHCSLYPVTDKMLEVCGEEIRPRQTGKGTIRFTVEDPLPGRVVAKLTRARLEEIDEAKTAKKAKTAK